MDSKDAGNVVTNVHDTETHKVCGTCGAILPVEDFYKDGKDRTGKVKRRRDCKECYKLARIKEAELKRKKGKGLKK